MATASRSLHTKLLITIVALLVAVSAFASAQEMKVTANGTLDTEGFSVVLYQNTYHPVFVDEKNAAMQMILHGQRIATNGDIRLVPTPEQWDLVAKLDGHDADKEHNRLTARLEFPTYQMSYTLEVAAEPGGVRVTINLDKPLPEKLAGRAGFNLEFLPSIYTGKTYAVDGKQFGILPRSPQDAMHQVLPSPDDPKKLPFQEDWDKSKGYTQPFPIVTGASITLAAEDPLTRITIASDTAPVSLYDGRDRAQNGWFVLRTLVPSGKTDGAIVWHIRPDLIPNWTRPPVIAHSQVGYPPDFPKVAVLELDPNFDAPKTAKVLRMGSDGQLKQVFEGLVSEPKPWLRYRYANFDFSSVKDPGLYEIEYAGQRTPLFPIGDDVYSHTWQSSLSGFLAVEMDHVSVREGYRIWHGPSHLDDARQAPLNWQHFDGYRQGPTTDSPYKPGDHIPGVNVGGWFDAGDYDNIAPSQYSVIEDLALAYKEFHLDWDELDVDEAARTVEMHRPDGVPDAVEQVKHGVLQILAQVDNIGHPIMGIIEPTLRQYTHLGDANSNTDGRVYSPTLGANEMNAEFSGKPDDRWAFTNKYAFLQFGAATALADASSALKGWDDTLAKKCLDTAIKLYNDERANPTPVPQGAGFYGGGAFAQVGEFRAALALMIATNGGDEYKKRVLELWPTVQKNFAFGGWTAVFALPYMDTSFKSQLEDAVRAYKAQVDADMAKNPFGVPPSLGTWGGSAQVAQFGSRMYFLHRAFPEIVGPEYTLRAANYLLGTHPVSSTSYISSVGAESKMHAYGNNRADNTFIPGGMIPGYIVIKPDFPECIDDFGMLWFEDEYTISTTAAWVLEATAADAVVKEAR